MSADWIEFALNVVGGAMAFLCLFEGARRLGVQGWKRGPLLTALLGLAFFGAYGAFAWWRHVDASETLALRYARPAPAQGAAQAAGDSSRARDAFVASGLLTHYLDRGEKKAYVPTQDDVRRRERMVAYSSYLVATARASQFEAALWGILAFIGAVAGFLFAHEKTRPAG